MEDVTLVEVPQVKVATARKTGRYEEVGNLLGVVFQYVTGNGLPMAGPPFALMRELTPEEAYAADEAGTADLEVAVPIGADAEGSNDVNVYDLPGGSMAKTLHRGPYSECGGVYEKLYAWLADNGKRVTGPIREVYLNDPNTVPPGEILTEIYAPVD